MQRRHFLQSIAVTSLLPAVPPLWAAEPPRTNSKPLMKLSLAAYSFNRLLRPRNGEPPSMTLLDFVDFCSEQNLGACELTSYYFPEVVLNTPLTRIEPVEKAHLSPEADFLLKNRPLRKLTRADREALKDVEAFLEPKCGDICSAYDYLYDIRLKCFHQGLDISGTAIGNDFCHPEGEKRDEQLLYCKDWIDRAAYMGAPVIRIFAGKVKKDQSEEEAIELCAAGINECLKYAEQRGVVLALENHGGITATPKQMLNIIEKVNTSPCFGVNFDSGNFQTETPYEDLQQIAPYAVNAQIKVVMKPNRRAEPADIPRIIKMLARANYRGYIVLEYEEPEDPHTEIRKYLAQLRETIETVVG